MCVHVPWYIPGLAGKIPVYSRSPRPRQDAKFAHMYLLITSCTAACTSKSHMPTLSILDAFRLLLFPEPQVITGAEDL